MVIDTLAVLSWQEVFSTSRVTAKSIDLGGPGWRDIFIGEPIVVGFEVDVPPGGSATFQLSVIEADNAALTVGVRTLAVRDVAAALLTKGATIWLTVPDGLARGRYLGAAVNPPAALTLSIFAQPGAMQEAQQIVGSGVPIAQFPAPPSTYGEIVLAAGPVGYWRLGEPSGTAANDSSGNARHGVYQNAPTLGATGALAGDADKAVTLNGTSQYITVVSNAAFSFTGTFSLECWVKPTAFGAASQVLIGHNNALSYQFDIGATGILRLLKRTAASPLLGFSTGSLTAGAWNHAVVTKQGAALHFYINGVEGTTLSTPDQDMAPSPDPAGLTFGQSFGNFLGGGLDEVAIYNRALTSGEVIQQYRAGAGL